MNDTTNPRRRGALSGYLSLAAACAALLLAGCGNPLAERVETVRKEAASPKFALGVAKGESSAAVALDGGVEFFDTSVSGACDLVFTVANAGKSELRIASSSIGGTGAASFSFAAEPPAAIAAGGSAAFTLRFSPGAPGAASATVSLATNDVDLPSFSFSLSGKGVSNAKSIESYGIVVGGTSYPGAIAGTDIAVTLPHGTPLANLVAGFSMTGASIHVGANPQVSGTTGNNFTRPVTYRVVAADNSERLYTVTVSVAPNSAKEITSFSLLGVAGAIDQGTRAISVVLPYGADFRDLVATFATTGRKVTVASAPQINAETKNDFSSPLDYTVTAEDGSSQDYRVTVSAAKNSEAKILSYSLSGAGVPACEGAINGTSISMTLPYNSNLANLIATFSLSAGATARIGGATQLSGQTSNDYTNALACVVTAEDGKSTASYTISVSKAASDAKAITAFRISGYASSTTIDQAAKTIAVGLTYAEGLDVSDLVATFSITGSSVSVMGALQTSGSTHNDFTAPVDYLVAAHDGGTAAYRVTVTVLRTAPKVATAAAASVAAASAALGGSILGTGGAAVTAKGVCYGTGPSPTVDGDKTSDASAGTVINVSATGLAAGSKYYARAYAVNSVGTAYGEEISFWTLPAAPGAPAVEKVGYPAGSGKLDISWGAVAGALDYQLYYSSSDNPPTSSYTLSDITATSTQVAGLANYTTYYFWIRARNASGTGSWSALGSASPGIHVTGVAIRRSGAAIAETTFLGPGATYAQQLAAVVEPENATDPSVTWASSNTAVCTVGSSGLATAAGALGDATIAVTTSADTDTGLAKAATVTARARKPGAPVLALVAGTRKVSATWAADPLATGYSLAYGTSGASLTNTAAPSSNAYTIEGLADKQTYYVAATASNGFGSTTGTTASVATLLPAPTGLLITSGVFANKLTLSWTYVSGATGYKVYYSTNPEVDSNCASWTTTTNNNNDFTGTAGTLYYFAVAATDGRESALSSVASQRLRVLVANDTWASASGSGTSLALASWDIRHTGSGWARTASTNYSGYYEMASSYAILCDLAQTIDLVNDGGYTAAQLQNPNTRFSFQVAAKTNPGTAGLIKVWLELFDSAGTSLAIIYMDGVGLYTEYAAGTSWRWMTASYQNTYGKAIAKVKVGLSGYSKEPYSGQCGPVFAQPRIYVTTP